MVRRITWVRTSRAGLRAASVAVDVPVAGLSANAARPPAIAAIAIATMREYFLRIAYASVSWGSPRLCRVAGYAPGKRRQRLCKADVLLRASQRSLYAPPASC